MRRRKRIAVREEEAAAAFIIPTDVLEEILHRFPSNDLLKFKIVCKDWLHLISSPGFIKKHLERSKAESREPRIVASQYSAEIEILCYHANNLTSNKIHWIMGNVRLLGSCDGLVLYMDCRNYKIGALNPSTQKTEGDARRLLKPSTENEIVLKSLLACTWFGRHPATGKYVLVVACQILGENSSIVFEVYDLSCNSLLSSLTEETVSCYLFRYQEIGTFLHGRLHVTALTSGYFKTDILAYDIQANKMLRMCAPIRYRPALGDIDGCLCALDTSEVWMLKEYGVEESWFKYANIDDKISIPLQICPSGDVILGHDFLKAIRKWATDVRNDNGRVVACIDSLVSPAVVFGRKE